MTPYHFNADGLKKAVASGGLVMVDFWASWCGPCRMLAPTIEKLAGQYEGKAIVGKVNTDDESALAASLGIMSIPTVIFFKDGVEIDRRVAEIPGEPPTAVRDPNRNFFSPKRRARGGTPPGAGDYRSVFQKNTL
mgnify:CR=1 FL=1